MLLGEEAMNRLEASRVAVFGVGGVGGFVVEALARSGIGTIDIIDNDTVALSNLNRQIIATMDTVGRDKVDVMKERIQSINPDAVVNARKCFFLPETAEQFDFTAYDYVVPIISAMGAGNKMDPTKFEVADIYSTSIDPLARVMRRELKKRGVKSLKVVYSKEKPMIPRAEAEENTCPEPAQETEEHKRRSTPGSLAFVPSVAGLIIAGEVIKDLAGL